MSGYDAARLIRQQPGSEKIVLIALTGWGQTADKTLASLAGFDHHLVKPVDYDGLMSCLAA
jgi:CheY-like chemotaxis protein